MRIVLFCQSLISDWNHGNAHFLRGIVSELMARQHDVAAYEPADGWSRQHLLADVGPGAITRFHRAFPAMSAIAADLDRLDLDEALAGADLVIVHEWSSPALVRRIGRHKARGGRGRYVLLFHDTHHRSVTDKQAMAQFDLSCYDGVLAFGEVIRQQYLALGWSARAWTWHEAADTRVFRPQETPGPRRDLVWIGNWGDDERSEELRSFLVEPVRDLGLDASIYGVRYPEAAQEELAQAGMRYEGWLANYDAPRVYGCHLMTVHIPRQPYVRSLPGIPTIRVFEALACGIPLVSAAWRDTEHLFSPGQDFLVAHTPGEMRNHLRALRADSDLRRSIAEHGLATIQSRHTCAHRVDELLAIVDEVRDSGASEVRSA
jgi:spore maturation protein CgeB